jgi:signal transduction histidine kinase
MTEAALPEIPRLYTALAEWSACMIFVIVLRNRFRGPRLFFAAALMLALQCGWHLFAGTLPVFLWIPGMIIAVALMFGLILGLCDIPVNDALVCCIRAFIIAEFAASLEWQAYCYFLYGRFAALPYELALLLAVYAAVFVLLYLIERKFAPGNASLGISVKEMLSAVIIGIAAFAISNISYVYLNTPFSVRLDSEIFLVRTMVNSSGLAILYACHIQCLELRTKRELGAIQLVLQNHYAQYRLSRENMESLNRKYHDLKNQIAVIRAEKDPGKQADYLDGLEESIRIYESQYRTGNTVLDTVLTGKSLYCAKHGIDMICMANGKLLDFMHAMDICTIFGNALDNAIEYEMNIANPQRRLIHLSLFSRRRFLLLRFENYFEGELEDMADGIPATTKKDPDYHGFGLKSIRYSVRKYGGSLTIKQKANWFELTILIPIPEDYVKHTVVNGEGALP